MDAVVFLQRLVEIPSVSGDEGAAAVFLVERMRALGFEAHVDAAGNAVGVRRGPPLPRDDGASDAGDAEPREIVLLGHMDTVPGHVPVRVVDGKLYGRGSVDANGPLAAFVEAVGRAEPAPGTVLTVIGVVEEEVASSRGAHHIARTRGAPEVCLIGEPSGWDALTLGYKGCTALHYERTQAVGHGAGEAPPVAEHAVRLWNRLEAYAAELNAGRERVVDQFTPSLRSMNTRGDGLHEEVTMSVGFRLPEGFDLEALHELVAEEADGARVRFDRAEPAWRTPRSTPVVGAFGRALAGHGRRLRAKHKTGTADLNVLGPVWRCPIVAYGPGDSRLDHTPDEHIVLDEYRASLEVLGRVLEELGFARRTELSRTGPATGASAAGCAAG